MEWTTEGPIDPEQHEEIPAGFYEEEFEDDICHACGCWPKHHE